MDGCEDHDCATGTNANACKLPDWLGLLDRGLGWLTGCRAISGLGTGSPLLSGEVLDPPSQPHAVAAGGWGLDADG